MSGYNGNPIQQISSALSNRWSNPGSYSVGPTTQFNFPQSLKDNVNAAVKKAQTEIRGITPTIPSGSNTGSAMGYVGKAVDLIGGFMPERDEYQGTYGDITQTMDSVYDATADALMAIPGWGTIAGGAMKVAGVLGDAVGSLGGSTDGMTKVDSILGSSFFNLTPFGLINGFGGKTTDTITKDEQSFEQVGASYGGTSATVDDALTKSGKKYGLFSMGAMNDANQEIAEAKRQQAIMGNISDIATDRRAISQSMAAINGNRRAYQLQGGYQQQNIRVGKHGMNIDLINRAKQILSYTEIEPISPQLLSKFKDGGQINKKSRTLQELIEYAKKENPRFIQRLSEPPRGIDFIDDEGNQARGSHYMEWSTDNNGNAIIYPRIQEVGEELKFFSGPDAYKRAVENKNYLIMTPEEAKLFFVEDSKYGIAYKSGWPQFFDKFQQGGSINVIPYGALHARKHNMDMDGITKKGIPVVSENKDGEIEQQAEIEREEVILRLEVTQKLEELEKKFYDSETSQKEKDEAALEAGKLLVEEILYNTDDKANLINRV